MEVNDLTWCIFWSSIRGEGVEHERGLRFDSCHAWWWLNQVVWRLNPNNVLDLKTQNLYREVHPCYTRVREKNPNFLWLNLGHFLWILLKNSWFWAQYAYARKILLRKLFRNFSNFVTWRSPPSREKMRKKIFLAYACIAWVYLPIKVLGL